MATYEFKSLNELAAWMDERANAVRASNVTSKQTAKRFAKREADTWANAAQLVRDSVIVQPLHSDSVMIDGVVKAKLNTDEPALLKIASDAYFGRTGFKSTYDAERNGYQFIGAIKAVRNATGLGLKEAKDWCDAHRSEFK